MEGTTVVLATPDGAVTRKPTPLKTSPLTFQHNDRPQTISFVLGVKIRQRHVARVEDGPRLGGPQASFQPPAPGLEKANSFSPECKWTGMRAVSFA